MKQEKNGKEKIRVTGSRGEIMIKNTQEEEMRERNKIEDECGSMKKRKNEEQSI